MKRIGFNEHIKQPGLIQLQLPQDQSSSSSKFDLETEIPLTPNQKKKLKQKAKKLSKKLELKAGITGESSSSSVPLVPVSKVPDEHQHDVSMSSATGSTQMQTELAAAEDGFNSKVVIDNTLQTGQSTPIRMRAELPSSPSESSFCIATNQSRDIDDTGSIMSTNSNQVSRESSFNFNSFTTTSNPYLLKSSLSFTSPAHVKSSLSTENSVNGFYFKSITAAPANRSNLSNPKGFMSSSSDFSLDDKEKLLNQFDEKGGGVSDDAQQAIIEYFNVSKCSV